MPIRHVRLATCLLFVAPAFGLAAEPETTVFRNGEDGIAEYRIPVLVTSTRGTLLAFCDARVNKPGDPPNYVDLVMKRSTDGGAHWGPVRRIADIPGGSVADSCGVVDRQTGTIWVLSCYCPPGIGSDNAVVGLTGRTLFYKAIRSDDDGKSWSHPIDLTSMVKKPTWRAGSFGPGRGCQTRSGRLVMPRYFTDNQSPPRVGVNMPAHSLACYSDDHGVTWKLGREAYCDGVTNESTVAETSDGSLLLNMRGSTGRYRRIARSRDGGETWSTVTEDRSLVDPHCQGTLIGIPDPDSPRGWVMLFSNCDSSRRERLTVRLSDDDGKSWPFARVLNPGPSAYSCLTVLADGTVGCIYERGVTSPAEEMRFVRFSLDWLKRGKATGRER